MCNRDSFWACRPCSGLDGTLPSCRGHDSHLDPGAASFRDPNPTGSGRCGLPYSAPLPLRLERHTTLKIGNCGGSACPTRLAGPRGQGNWHLAEYAPTTSVPATSLCDTTMWCVVPVPLPGQPSPSAKDCVAPCDVSPTWTQRRALLNCSGERGNWPLVAKALPTVVQAPKDLPSLLRRKRLSIARCEQHRAQSRGLWSGTAS